MVRTQVGIVGAGPAGLLLSQLLALRGVESVVVDVRSRADIESTIKAGVLEQGTVDRLTRAGVGERLVREGTFQRGIALVFGGALHHVDFAERCRGRAITLYPQHKVLQDLIARRLADGGDLRFGVAETQVTGIETDRPVMTVPGPTGGERIECDFVVGCDGSHSMTRTLIPDTVGRTYFRQYPFAWFAILAMTPRPWPEVIYAHSERGFALVSSRSPDMQRMYFQCDPATDPADWSTDRIWDELRTRVAAPGVAFADGEIVDKSVVQFRSLVRDPMQYGRLFLAGDAAHTVPPTGAKGMNLAVADVCLLDEALGAHYGSGDDRLLAAYSETALRRVWRTQQFCWWMTALLHRFPVTGDDSNGFDLRRQRTELEMLVSTPSALQTFADDYVGPAL